MEINELKNKLKECGVVGAGGAGFPSYAKLSDKAETIILNCAECEPLITLHRQLLKCHALEIFKALDLLCKTLNVNCVIGIKSAYEETLETINPLVKNFDNISIKELAESYPTGDEVVLIYEVTGKIIPAGGLPISSGIIVFNVETVYNIYCAVYENKPVTHKYVTVGGAVKNPATLCVPVGTSFGQLVKMCGGETVESFQYVSGGVMMGKLASKTDVVVKTTNAVLVFPKNHLVVTGKMRNPRTEAKRAAASCCQCRMCTDLCPRALLGHPIDPARFMRAASNKNSKDQSAYMGALYCSSCGLCESFACMQGLSPRALLESTKNTLRAAGIKPETVPGKVDANRRGRLVPLKRLEGRLNLGAYENDAPITDLQITPQRLIVKLSQHIGAPSICTVEEGKLVCRGEIIAKAADGLSVSLASPADGKVLMITNSEIIIECNQSQG